MESWLPLSCRSPQRRALLMTLLAWASSLLGLRSFLARCVPSLPVALAFVIRTIT